MADIRKHSVTSNVVRFLLKHATTGVGLTGLTEASSGLIISTIADNEATTTRYRAGSSEIETIATLGTFAAPTSGKCRFKEVDATNHKGLYEFQFADARFAVASAKRLVISVTGATNLLDTDYEVQLMQVDHYDATRFGVSALPNAAAEASGGLATLSGAQASNGTIQANVHRWLTGTPNALQSGRVDSYLGALAADVITAAGIAADAGTEIATAVWASATRTLSSFGTLAADVWAVATRVLTAGTNIVLAKGTGVTGFNDLSAAQVNTEADTALADAGVTTTVTGRIDAAVSSRASATALATAQTSIDDLPTNAELATAFAAADDAVLTAIAALNNISAAGVRAAVGLAAANLDTQLAGIDGKTTNLPSDPADQSLIIAATTALASAIAALNNLSTVQVKAQADQALADAGVTSVRLAKLDGLPEGVKKNTALANFSFFLASNTDHATGLTGATVTATRSLDGAAFGACANAVAEIGSGFYKINLAAADLNGDIAVLLFTATGADPRSLTLKLAA